MKLEDIKLKLRHNHIATNYHNEEDYREINVDVATIHFIKSENVPCEYDEILTYELINEELGLMVIIQYVWKLDILNLICSLMILNLISVMICKFIIKIK